MAKGRKIYKLRDGQKYWQNESGSYEDEKGTFVFRNVGGKTIKIYTNREKGYSLATAMRESGKFERLKKDKEHFMKMDRELRKMQKQAQDDFDRDFDKARNLGSDKLELEAKENRDKIVGEINEERFRLANEWKEREKGKEYIDDYPEAYRHYERDWDSTQWVNDSTDLRKEFGLDRQDYPDEKDYMPGGKKWNPEWASSRETKLSNKQLNNIKNVGNQRTYDQVDKEWTDLAKKMEKDYDEFGTTNWRDEKRLNELSAERDRLSVYDYKSDRQKIKDDIKRIGNTDINSLRSLAQKVREKEKTPYNSKAYAKELSQLYNAEEEYDDNITPKYIQDIDSARYGNMSDEEAIKNWIEGGADLVYVDDAKKKLEEWGIKVKNDDPYGTYRDELAKQLLPIYKEDKRVLGLKQRFKGTYEDLKDNTNMSEAEILEFLKKLQNK